MEIQGLKDLIITRLTTEFGAPIRKEPEYLWEVKWTGHAPLTIAINLRRLEESVTIWLFNPVATSAIQAVQHIQIKDESEVEAFIREIRSATSE